MCATVRSTSRTSLDESLLPSCASVHSRHSTRNSLPGATEAAGGMSGCQRLWPGTAWSAIDFDWSTLKTTSGMGVLLFGLDDRTGPGTNDVTARCTTVVWRARQAFKGSPRDRVHDASR